METGKAVLKVRRQKRDKVELTGEKHTLEDRKTGYHFRDGNDIDGRLILEDIPGGRTARLILEISNTAVEENACLEMERPVAVDLEIVEKPEKMTALYLFSDWWTRPVFPADFDEIPPRTQVLFLKYPDRYGCLIPGAGESFKTCLVPGGKSVLSMEMTAYTGGINRLDEPVFILAEDRDFFRAVERAFAQAAESGGIRRKAERRLPRMFRYLGWCTWNAFYTEVSEEKIREKVREFEEKEVPVRWIMIDDGWLSVKGSRLCDFAPDQKKFPDGFAKLTEEIRSGDGISWFGVWHALGGYWGGILPESSLDKEEAPHLCRTPNGKVLPRPQAEAAYGFYRDWYRLLRKEGIDFVKVDGQSAVKNYYENMIPVCRAARELHAGLEGAAACFDGAVLNCMGMAAENLLARPATAVSRSSDDFFPEREDGFSGHLLQNAYNTLYQDELYYCDWDMFWTDHRDSRKHSLLRAVSGGPVYFSDRTGSTMPEVLKPLVYLDGEILMMDRGAKMPADCVFSDPGKTGVLKLTNVGACGGEKRGGGIAVYNLSGQKQAYTVSPSDIADIGGSGQYWIYDYFSRNAVVCKRHEAIRAEIEKEGYAWYQILCGDGPGTFLGLTGKYAGFLAVESMFMTERGMTAVVREQGSTGFLSLREPAAVRCNGRDVLKDVERNGCVYTLELEEKKNKMMLEVVWEE